MKVIKVEGEEEKEEVIEKDEEKTLSTFLRILFYILSAKLSGLGGVERVKKIVNDLKSFLTNFLEQFNKDDYKTDFPWIDALKEINDLSKIKKLNDKLLNEINKSIPNNLWLIVPEILDWTDHGGFKFSNRKKDDGLLDDIHVKTFKEYLDCDLIELSHLENNSIYRFNQSDEYLKDHWRVYECLYFEYSEGKETCFLTSGKWYAVKNSLVQTVKDFYGTISTDTYGLNFIDYNHADENAYNTQLAIKNKALGKFERLVFYS